VIQIASVDLNIPYEFITFHTLDKVNGFVMLQLNIPEEALSKFDLLEINSYDTIYVYPNDKQQGKNGDF
jgi:hypothetical protein